MKKNLFFTIVLLLLCGCASSDLKYQIGSFLKIFPVYEKFYPTGLE